MTLISCENLSYSYEGKYALKDISFKVEPNDYLCIIGENGAGKTTLIKGLLNLKKMTSGELIFDDSLSRDDIGYLPQKNEAQKDFPASVYEVVLSGCLNRLKLRPFYNHKEKQIALDNIERLGLTPLKNKSFKDLSGGQQQRVLLARALCSSRKLLILDEPITGLDPLVKEELYDLIDMINKELNITIIMVSHDVRSACEHAKTILHLNKEQLFFGSSKDYQNSELGKRFLGENL